MTRSLSLRRLLFSLLMLLLTALSLGGCGAASTESSAGSQILNVPYQADIGPPDPDIFYGIEGNTLIQSIYQGLVQYTPNSNRIEPLLATSWTMSTDRLTYTFKLRSGVHFADGTAMTAAAWIVSIKRRLNVNNASVYMVKPIASMSAPDPSTLVIRLKHPVSAFMDYLASTYGPKAIGPLAIVTNAGKDFGQTYLRTHSDGTGPYELSSFKTGQQYLMVRNPHYWGAAPHFQKVMFTIVPSAGTEYQQLASGGDDLILHSFPVAELASARANKSLQVLTYPSNLMSMLALNTRRAPFSSLDARHALTEAINLQQMLATDYGGTATLAQGAYPAAMMSDQPKLDYRYNPSAARAVFSHVAQRAIILGYVADSSGVDFNLAQTLQTELDAVGLKVTIEQYQVTQTYDFAHTATARSSSPDILIADDTPDAAHPDTWARINWDSTGGLNWFGWSDPTVDSLLNQAIQQPTAQGDAIYREVGKIVMQQAPMVFLADMKDVILTRSDLTGIVHTTAYPWALDLAMLERK